MLITIDLETCPAQDPAVRADIAAGRHRLMARLATYALLAFRSMTSRLSRCITTTGTPKNRNCLLTSQN